MRIKESQAKAEFVLDRGLAGRLAEIGVGHAEIRRFGFINSDLEALARMPAVKAAQALLDIGRAKESGLKPRIANEFVLNCPRTWEEKLKTARQLMHATTGLPEEAAIRITMGNKDPAKFIADVGQGMRVSRLESLIRRDEVFMLAANHPNDFEDLVRLAEEADMTPSGKIVMSPLSGLKGVDGPRLSALKEDIPRFLRTMAATPLLTFNEVKTLTRDVDKDLAEHATLIEQLMGEMPGCSPYFCKVLARFSNKRVRSIVLDVEWLYSELPQLSFYDCQRIALSNSRTMKEFAACFKKVSAAPEGSSRKRRDLIADARALLKGGNEIDRASGAEPPSAQAF